MHTHHESTVANCHGCSCRLNQNCRAEDSHASSLSGWRLVLGAMGLFLGPSFLAIVGASCFGESHCVRFVAAIAGLAVGMIGSAVVANRLIPNAIEIPGNNTVAKSSKA